MTITAEFSMLQVEVGERRRAVIAATIGNALEWFDLVVYILFSAVISKLFFPAGSETVSLLLALATYGATFLMRPLGAVVIGAHSDRHGRRAALTMSISLMMLGTFLVVVAPTFATAGIAAPIILVVARLIQGFSGGGEFGSATTFLAEQDRARRGFYSSLQFAGQALAIVLASAFAFVLTSALTMEQMESWGWRVPFLFGLLIGPVGYYMRSHVAETPEFRRETSSASPLREALSSQSRPLIATSGLIVVATVAGYTMFFLPTYGSRELGIPLADGFRASVVASAIQVVLIPIFGALSDRHGRTPLAILAAAAFAVLSYPLFSWLVSSPSVQTLLAVQLAIATLTSIYVGSMPALMADLFPTRTRTTGMAIGYSIGVTIFGGFAPLIIASLIAVTGSKLAPGLYLAFAALLSLAALLFVRRLGAR